MNLLEGEDEDEEEDDERCKSAIGEVDVLEDPSDPEPSLGEKVRLGEVLEWEDDDE